MFGTRVISRASCRWTRLLIPNCSSARGSPAWSRALRASRSVVSLKRKQCLCSQPLRKRAEGGERSGTAATASRTDGHARCDTTPPDSALPTPSALSILDPPCLVPPRPFSSPPLTSTFNFLTYTKTSQVVRLCGYLALTTAIVGGTLATTGEDEITADFVARLREDMEGQSLSKRAESGVRFKRALTSGSASERGGEGGGVGGGGKGAETGKPVKRGSNYDVEERITSTSSNVEDKIITSTLNAIRKDVYVSPQLVLGIFRLLAVFPEDGESRERGQARALRVG